jgi:hypothetical protein
VPVGGLCRPFNGTQNPDWVLVLARAVPRRQHSGGSPRLNLSDFLSAMRTNSRNWGPIGLSEFNWHGQWGPQLEQWDSPRQYQFNYIPGVSIAGTSEMGPYIGPMGPNIQVMPVPRSLNCCSVAGAIPAIRRTRDHRLLRRSSASPTDARQPRRLSPLPAPALRAAGLRQPSAPSLLPDNL